jgi:hypothetical protein
LRTAREIFFGIGFYGVWFLAIETSEWLRPPAFLVGSQSVGLAEFRGQAAGGLVLTAFQMREILADPASESAPNAQITNAIREMLAEK